MLAKLMPYARAAAVAILAATFQVAAADDAAPTDSVVLRGIEVTGVAPRAEIIPAQRLKGAELQQLSSHSIADALRYFSGVQVKDYGGVGGIKTVNVRSMGTNHTGVVYDGVALGNAQNGQIDLGQFSLTNIEEISLHNGQKSEILQPARDFGNAGSVYIRTRRPVFEPGHTWNLRAQMRAGSFGVVNPSLVYERQLGDRVSASLSAELLSANGRYRFRYRRVTPSGDVAYDTTATRHNGDVLATRAELNLNGSISAGHWTAKVYNYWSERGIPGAIVSNVWRRGERLWDCNTFAQASLTRVWGRYTLLANAKYAYYRTRYRNDDERMARINNLYRQQEAYVSTAHQLELLSGWRASAAVDVQWNTMTASMTGFSRPTRLTALASAATSLIYRRLAVQGALLYTHITDRTAATSGSTRRWAVTPSVYASVRLTRQRILSLRAFYKQSYRMPTFNDLYYTDMGNASLRPERASQLNAGLVFTPRPTGAMLRAAEVSADAYYNRITDKIVAYPKGQQFRWTMLNLGKVDIRGLDIAASATLRPLRMISAPARDLELTLRAQYTFQRAIDVTSAADAYYRHQIPYIPRHSGSVIAQAEWKGFMLSYSFIYVGERYNQQENILYNYTQPWYTSDLSASKSFTVSGIRMRLMAEVNNLLNQSYDVIINYPMPGRNFRFTLNVEI